MMAVHACEGQFLHGLVLALRPKVIVEIGTGQGVSLRHLCDAAESIEYGPATCCRNGLTMPTVFARKSCQIWSCDVLQERIDYAHRFCPEVNFVCGDAAILFAQMGDQAGLVFIDGDHKYAAVASDFDLSLARLDKRGVIVLHDADTDYHPDVRDFCRTRGIMVLPTPMGMGVYVK